MKWELEDILKALSGWGILAALSALIVKKMDWKRFKKTDIAKEKKVVSETALDLALIAEKQISDEVKISNAALQWALNFSASSERAYAMLDKKQEEIERLHVIIDDMKANSEIKLKEIKDDFIRVEDGFKTLKWKLLMEREEDRKEIKRLKDIIDANS